MAQCMPPQGVVVKIFVAFQPDQQALARTESGEGEYLANPTIEALDHAVGLRLARFEQAMLDAQQYPLTIKPVVARRFLCLAGETVGELTAIVGERFDDFHRRDCLEATEKVRAADLVPVVVDTQKRPARRTADGNE